MKFNIIFFLTFCTGLYIGCLKPQTALPEKESDKAAAKSLKTFCKLITEENYRKMGFESSDEIKKATLDNSIQDYLIDLASLKEYRIGNDPEKLLTPTNSLVYPVIVDGEVRTSITISYKDKKWEAHSFGYSNFTKLLAHQLNIQSKKQKLTWSSFFIVRIPALNLVFLGYHLKEKMMLSAILDTPNYGLIAGNPLPADILLAKLISSAENYDDMPR